MAETSTEAAPVAPERISNRVGRYARIFPSKPSCNSHVRMINLLSPTFILDGWPFWLQGSSALLVNIHILTYPLQIEPRKTVISVLQPGFVLRPSGSPHTAFEYFVRSTRFQSVGRPQLLIRVVTGLQQRMWASQSRIEIALSLLRGPQLISSSHGNQRPYL